MPPDGAKFLIVIAVRTLIVLVALIGGLRLLGKRQTAQFNLYDLALVMLLANAVQNAMTQGDGHILVGIVSAGTVLVSGWVATQVFRNAPLVAQHVTGISTLLISDGRFIRQHMQRERITEDEVLAAMRQHGIPDLSRVRMAVLEVDGSISIVPTKAEHHTIKKVAKRSRRRQ